MKPTEILTNEHRVIEQVLDCLEKIAHETEVHGKLNAADARDAVEFFRNFADKCHHGKEEAQLFPMIESRGVPREGGPTGVMMHEHELGRAYIRGIAESIDAAAGGDGEAICRFIDCARRYTLLLREHIQKEDHCLFPMADTALTAADQRELMARFERVEHEEMGEGTHERYLGIANALADRYGVPRARIAAEPAHGGFSCGHHH